MGMDLPYTGHAIVERETVRDYLLSPSHPTGKGKADPLRGLFETTMNGKPSIVEYEPDSDLRDTEQVPLLEDGGIEAFIRLEVLPYTPTHGSRKTPPRSVTR